MAAPKNAEYDAQTEETDEYVEVQGGNYAPVWDFDENPIFEGVYKGFIVKPIKGEDKVIHTFEHAEIGEVQAWGAAVLNSRLEGLEGVKVRVWKTGAKLTSSTGRSPWEFKVYASKRALAG